jgi:hypothetical protein
MREDYRSNLDLWGTDPQKKTPFFLFLLDDIILMAMALLEGNRHMGLNRHSTKIVKI